MSTINTSARLAKRALLTNLFITRGTSITPLLNGPHGIGKTAVCYQIAKSLNGLCLVVEGGSLKEGEITGIPFGQKNSDGSSEVRFIPYYQTAAIQRVEKEYYNIAKEKGFLNGNVKLLEDGSVEYVNSKNNKVIIPAETMEEKLISGEENKYSFGENLPAEVKLKLLESGEIKPVVLLVDEMNRTDNQTMKELMNIVLTRTVNGYKYPWWVFVVSAINPCGQDSIYSTNEMDPAQLDRFLTIKVNADINEWVDWAIDNDLNEDYIVALSSSEEIFQQRGKGYEESEEADQMPTPRSHTICSYIYQSADKLNKSSFFTPEEVKESEDDVRQLIIGKIGRRAGNTILAALRNKENYIDPKDILTGTEKVVNEKILAKIMKMKSIAKRILMKNIARYISRDLGKVYYDQHDKNADVASSAKTKWANVMSQLKSLVSQIDLATQLIFAKDALDTNLELSDSKYQKYNSKFLFSIIGPTFSTEIVQQVAMTNKTISNGDIDKQ